MSIRGFTCLLLIAPVLLGSILILSGSVVFQQQSFIGYTVYLAYWFLCAWPILFLKEELRLPRVLFRLRESSMIAMLLGGFLGVLLFSLSILKNIDLATLYQLILMGGAGEARGALMFSEAGGVIYYAGVLLIPLGIYALIFGIPFLETYKVATRVLFGIFLVSFASFGLARLGRTTFVFATLVTVSVVLYTARYDYWKKRIFPILMLGIAIMLLGISAMGIWRQSESISTGYSVENELSKMTGMKIGDNYKWMPEKAQHAILHLGHYCSAPLVGIGLILEDGPKSVEGLPAYTHFSIFARRIYPLFGIDEQSIQQSAQMSSVVTLNDTVQWSTAVWLTAVYFMMQDFGAIGSVLFAAGFGIFGWFALQKRSEHPFWVVGSVFHFCYCAYFTAQPFFRENYYQTAFILICLLPVSLCFERIKINHYTMARRPIEAPPIGLRSKKR